MKKIKELLDYINLRGKNLLELLNQNFFLIFYSCLLFNLIIIFILFLNKVLWISFIFFLTLMIVLKLERFIKIGKINIYNSVHKKLIFLNLILLLLNIINIALMYSDIYVIMLDKFYGDILEIIIYIISHIY